MWRSYDLAKPRPQPSLPPSPLSITKNSNLWGFICLSFSWHFLSNNRQRSVDLKNSVQTMCCIFMKRYFCMGSHSESISTAYHLYNETRCTLNISCVEHNIEVCSDLILMMTLLLKQFIPFIRNCQFSPCDTDHNLWLLHWWHFAILSCCTLFKKSIFS